MEVGQVLYDGQFVAYLRKTFLDDNQGKIPQLQKQHSLKRKTYEGRSDELIQQQKRPLEWRLN